MIADRYMNLANIFTLACECKGSTDVTTYLGPDEQTITVTWRSPEEDENRCKLVESPERKPGSEFSVGKYNLAYVFSNRKNQRTTCPVNINVEREYTECNHAKTVLVLYVLSGFSANLPSLQHYSVEHWQF